MTLLELEFKISSLLDIPALNRSPAQQHMLALLTTARRDYFHSYADYLSYITSNHMEHYSCQQSN